MTNKQIAIAYFEDAMHGTTSTNWIWSKNYVEEFAGRTVDMEDLGDVLWDLFGDYLLDSYCGDDGIDCIIGGYYCDYMNPENISLEEYRTLIWTEFYESFDSEEEVIKERDYHIEQYKNCIKYINSLKENTND